MAMRSMKCIALWRSGRRSLVKGLLGQVLAERAVFKETVSSCLIYTVVKEAGLYIFVNKSNGIKDALFLTGVAYRTLSWPTAQIKKDLFLWRGNWQRKQN